MAAEDLRLQQKNDAEMHTAEMASKGASAVLTKNTILLKNEFNIEKRLIRSKLTSKNV